VHSIHFCLKSTFTGERRKFIGAMCADDDEGIQLRRDGKEWGTFFEREPKQAHLTDLPHGMFIFRLIS